MTLGHHTICLPGSKVAVAFYSAIILPNSTPMSSNIGSLYEMPYRSKAVPHRSTEDNFSLIRPTSARHYVPKMDSDRTLLKGEFMWACVWRFDTKLTSASPLDENPR